MSQQVASTRLDTGVEPDGFWNEPDPGYWDRALAQLGLELRALQPLPEGEYGVPMGVSVTVDAVYTKAWELQLVEESASSIRLRVIK